MSNEATEVGRATAPNLHSGTPVVEGEPMDTESESTELEPRDELICALLARGWTQNRIAAEVGCSTRTIRRRLEDPTFAGEVKARRRAAVSATVTVLEHLGVDAAAELRNLLVSDNDHVRLRAIELVLRLGRQYHREDLIEADVLARLEAVEAIAADKGVPGGTP
jgi:DNA-binding transcriptional regulator LsrR (DeoR family)